MLRSRLASAALCAAGLGCAASSSNAPAGPAPAASRPAGAAPAIPAVRRGAIVYQPMAPTAYVLRRDDTVNVQLPNGLPQTQTLSRTAYLTVATAAGTPMNLSITLDSLVAEGPGAAMLAVDSARGTHWTGTLSADGHFSELTSDRTTPVGEQLRGMLPELFPVLPAGGAREGAAWTDTAKSSIRAMAFDVKEDSRIASRAVADTIRIGGRNGIRIESDVTFTRSGGGSQFGQAVEVQATGRRHVTSRLRPDGVVAETSGTESSDMTLTIPAVGQSLPVKQTATFSLMLAAARH
jgi:hypothetical protein